MILVPYLEFKVAGFPLSYNLVNTLLLGVFLYQAQINRKYELDFEFILPFLFLYFSLLFLSLFTWVMPWGLQFTSWRASLMQTGIVSFIIWNIAKKEQKFLDYVNWAFIISIAIAGIYGIFLLRMEGLNPYTSKLSDYFGKTDFALNFSDSEARLDFSTTAKIQSTMAHPMTWTLVLCFSMIILWAVYLKTQNKMLWILIAIIGFNVLIAGVRTGIASLTMGFIYFVIRYKKFKLIALTIVALIIVGLIVQSNDSLSNLFASFTDFSGQNSQVAGSSITMRLNQFEGVLTEIRGNDLVGKGYGWTNYYLTNNGKHPVILAFESLLFIVLCNSGFIGLMVWLLFFFMLFRLNRKISNTKESIFLLDTFVITFIAFTIGTGEYGYMPFFAIFYSFLMGYLSKYEVAKVDQIHRLKRPNNKSYIKFELSNT